MEGIQKKFGNGQGLPPIPLPSSFSRKNTGDDAGKEAKATAEPETEDRRRWINLYLRSFFKIS